MVTLRGRDVYLGAYGSPESKAEYRRVIAEFLAAGREDPQPPLADAMTWCELAARYLRYAAGYYRTPDGSQRVEKAVHLVSTECIDEDDRGEARPKESRCQLCPKHQDCSVFRLVGPLHADHHLPQIIYLDPYARRNMTGEALRGGGLAEAGRPLEKDYVVMCGIHWNSAA